MADIIARTFVALDGWSGAPGVNVIHWSPLMSFPASISDYDPTTVANALAQLHTAYAEVAPRFVQGVTVTFPAETALIEASTGQMVGAVVAGTVPAAITATGSPGTTSRATQATLSLQTPNFINGRRVQGRLFLGPLGNDGLGSDGKVKPEYLTIINGAFADLTTGGGGDAQLVVWHRPKGGAANGASCPVSAVAARATPGSLRSRRD